MVKIVTKKRNRSGKSVTFPVLGVVKFEDDCTSVVSKDKFEELENPEGRSLFIAEEVVTNDDGEEVLITVNVGPEATKEATSEELTARGLTFKQLKEMCGNAGYPESEWKSMRSQKEIAEYVISKF